MKTTYRLSGVKLLAKGGSLIFCENCQKIVGSINKSGYRYIALEADCCCGNRWSIEIARPDSSVNPLKRLNRMTDRKDGVHICKKCGEPIFGIVASQVGIYSFYTQCVCGEKYDSKSNSFKRLEETARILKLRSISQSDKAGNSI